MKSTRYIPVGIDGWIKAGRTSPRRHFLHQSFVNSFLACLFTASSLASPNVTTRRFSRQGRTRPFKDGLAHFMRVLCVRTPPLGSHGRQWNPGVLPRGLSFDFVSTRTAGKRNSRQDVKQNVKRDAVYGYSSGCRVPKCIGQIPERTTSCCCCKNQRPVQQENGPKKENGREMRPESQGRRQGTLNRIVTRDADCIDIMMIQKRKETLSFRTCA
jgi:hypothetical protein